MDLNYFFLYDSKLNLTLSVRGGIRCPVSSVCAQGQCSVGVGPNRGLRTGGVTCEL